METREQTAEGQVVGEQVAGEQVAGEQVTVDGAALDRSAPEEPDELALAAEFPATDRDEWVALVDQVLRRSGRIGADAPPGAGVEALTATTPDGVRLPPLCTAEDVSGLAPGVPGRAPFVRGSRAAGVVPDGWDVRQRHAEPDAVAARSAIRADLENGVSSIWLAVGEGGTPVEGLREALADVYLDMAPVVLDAGAAAVPAAEAYLALAEERGVAPDVLLGTLGLDPVGLRARTGDGPPVPSVVPLALRVAAEFPRMRALVVDALPVHGAGGSDAQELGFSLAAGVAYLRALAEAGLEVDSAARLLEFRYAATAEQFPTIAKLRAARRLWAQVLEACGSAEPSAAQRQHAVTSPVMLTRRDPYVNLLRGTVAGFAAGVGGADAVTVAPFDAAIGAPEPFSRRVARNTQTLLVEEAHLARVIDPAGGSWFVERLTDDLARAAWAFFQEIEAGGGVLAALDSGLVAERTAAVRERRVRAVATRRTALTGVSEFPDLAERPLRRRPLPAVADGSGTGARSGLPVYRPAEPFEALRDRSDAQLAATGTRPRAFLATLGPLAAHTARAGFARNLLQAGGVEAPDAGPTTTDAEVTRAYAEAGAPVAVVCGTDALYDERAAATVAALRAAGARLVLLAGRAEVPGLDGHLYAGCDALAVIESVYAAQSGPAQESDA